MESLIAASESFYDEEEVNADLFNSFMKRITVWDYSYITREHYLSLPNHEKEAMIKKYFFDLKSRTCGKILLFFLLRLKLFEMFFVNYFARQELVNKLLTDGEIDVKKVYWYCKDGKKCERFYSIRSEFKKKGFSTFKEDIKYWDVRDHEQFEIRPIRDPKFRV